MIKEDEHSIAHHLATLRLAGLVAKKQATGTGDELAKEVGETLLRFGLDQNTDGFWVWDIQNNIEYFSPEFTQSLGFEGEHDFPHDPSSWQKQIFKEDVEHAIDLFYKHVESEGEVEYKLDCRYNTKQNDKAIELNCRGTIVNFGEERLIMLGSHRIHNIIDK